MMPSALTSKTRAASSSARSLRASTFRWLVPHGRRSSLSEIFSAAATKVEALPPAHWLTVAYDRAGCRTRCVWVINDEGDGPFVERFFPAEAIPAIERLARSEAGRRLFTLYGRRPGSKQAFSDPDKYKLLRNYGPGCEAALPGMIALSLAPDIDAAAAKRIISYLTEMRYELEPRSSSIYVGSGDVPKTIRALGSFLGVRAAACIEEDSAAATAIEVLAPGTASGLILGSPEDASLRIALDRGGVETFTVGKDAKMRCDGKPAAFGASTDACTTVEKMKFDPKTNRIAVLNLKRPR